MSILRRISNLWWLAGKIDRDEPISSFLHRITGSKQAMIVDMSSPLDVII